MFERACTVLKDSKIAEDSFSVLFACYRNYSSGNQLILQSSPWESKPANLKIFLDQVSPSGG